MPLLPIRCVLTSSRAEKECWTFFKLLETGLNTTSCSPWLAIHLQNIWIFFYPSLILMGPNSLGPVLSICPPKDYSHSGWAQIYSSVSYLLQASSRHIKDIFGIPTRQPIFLTETFQNLPQSSTFLQILYHWACWKRKKASRNWPLLIRLTKKGNVSFCCPVSMHESVSSCLTLYIQALRDRDCHFNLYFSVLSTTAHDEASGHYSNINSSNKINMMAIPKVWFEKNYLVTPLFWTFIHARSRRGKSRAFSVKSLNLC